MKPAILTILVSFMLSTSAYGVIPSLLSPLQGLLAILPQIFAFIVAGFAVLFGFKPWRLRFSRLLSVSLKTKVIVGVAIFVVIGGSATVPLVYNHWLTGLSGQNPQIAGRAWQAFRGGPTRTGNIDLQSGPEKGEKIWAFRSPDFHACDFSSSPAVVGNRIYVGSAQASVFSSSGMVYCLDAESGKMIWKFQTPREIFSSPAVVDGKVYIGEGLHRDVDAKLYCLDSATGFLLWSFQTSNHIESSPVVVNNRVFFGGGEDGVYCVDAKTGEQIWRYPGIHVDISPAVYENNVYVGTGYGDTSIYCLDANTGTRKWHRQLDYPIWGSPSLANNRAFFGIGNGNFVESDSNPHGGVICLDATTSEIIWKYKVNDSVLTAIALNDGRAYFGSRDGYLYCLSADSGKLIWKWSTGEPVLSSPAIAGEYIYFGSNNGILYCLGRSSGELKWKFDAAITASANAKILSSPAVADSKVYVGSSKQYFFCIGEASVLPL